MIIDDTDIRNLGMFILRGGSNDFLSFPERKDPDQNDWAEYDGLDVDFSDLSYHAKKVSVQLYISATTGALLAQRLNTFQTLNNQLSYREVFVKDFGMNFLLRYLGCSTYLHRGGIVRQGRKSGKITVEYMMDDPTQFFIAPGVPTGNGTTYVGLGANDLGKYGIVVKDIYSSELNPGLLKPVLERTFKNLDGIKSDVLFIPKKTGKVITIDCEMVADSFSEFFNNYNALFGAMNVPTPLELNTSTNYYICYYKSMTGFTKHTSFNRRVHVSFKLNLQTV